jgi:hypothetical protein
MQCAGDLARSQAKHHVMNTWLVEQQTPTSLYPQVMFSDTAIHLQLVFAQWIPVGYLNLRKQVALLGPGPKKEDEKGKAKTQ